VSVVLALGRSDLPSNSMSCAERRYFETSPSGGLSEVSIARLQPRNLENAPFPVIGTVLAVSKYALGVAAFLPRNTGRGGARNRADRESHFLTDTQIANLRAAERFAGRIGSPFTRMITIHWEAAGVPLAGMAKATGRFTGLLAKTFARHDCETAWLWVHENGHGKGGHCHLLVHVPATLVPRLTGLQRGWLRLITGRPYRARVIHSDPVGGWLGLEASNPDLHAVNLETAFRYVLKGASAEAASRFALERLEPGGLIIGKRCGTSQNIGAEARKARDC
jgi:hypothetical protein